MVVVLTSIFGFEPAINTDASGRRIAEEWYKRAMFDVANPSLDHREPAGALGS